MENLFETAHKTAAKFLLPPRRRAGHLRKMACHQGARNKQRDASGCGLLTLIKLPAAKPAR